MKISLVKWVNGEWQMYYFFNTIYLCEKSWKEDIIRDYENYEICNDGLEDKLLELKEDGEIEDYIIITGEKLEDLIEEIERFITLREII